MKGFISFFLPKAFLSLAGYQLCFTATGCFRGSIVTQPQPEICLPPLFQGIWSLSKAPGTASFLKLHFIVFIKLCHSYLQYPSTNLYKHLDPVTSKGLHVLNLDSLFLGNMF